MRSKDLARFIVAREQVRVNKEQNKPRPWTKDPILHQYRFCNVRREDDTVTRWIHENWLMPWAGNDDIWFAMVVARLFNLPESLKAIQQSVLPWRPRQVARALAKRRALGKNIFNAAYIVSTNGLAMDKLEYVITRVLNPLWEQRKNMRPKPGQLLGAYHHDLMQFQGMGSFMAAQVVADLKWVNPLLNAADWATWAAPGPGSKRGLNRVCERDIEATWPGSTWWAGLDALRKLVNKELSFTLDAQNLQNCLCEFDKYERARTGAGRPKQIYRSST